MASATGIVAETPNIVFHIETAAGILALMVLYFFGVWSRSFIFPTGDRNSFGRQLVAAIPVGVVTITLYAKTTFPTLSFASTDLVFNCSLMIGYTILFGMLSRETLDRMLKGMGSA